MNRPNVLLVGVFEGDVGLVRPFESSLAALLFAEGVRAGAAQYGSGSCEVLMFPGDEDRLAKLEPKVQEHVRAHVREVTGTVGDWL